MGTRRRLVAMVTVVVALGSAAPLAQAAANDCPTVFNGAIHYELVSVSCTGPICTIVFSGSGGSTLGPVTDTLRVVQNFASTPCPTFTSEHTMSFAGSRTLTAVGEGTVCGNPGGSSFISETSAVTGGTGGLENTIGTVFGEGVSGPTGPVVHFHGTLDC
jgi:hypothetical protein